MHTANAIAQQCGIQDDQQDSASEEDQKERRDALKYSNLTGKEFRELVGGLVIDSSKQDDLENSEPAKSNETIGNMHMFKKIKQHLRVISRCSPTDKYLLVKGLQATGEVEKCSSKFQW